MSLAYLVGGMMIFLRSLGVVLQLPMIAGRAIPIPLRLGLCVCLTVVLAGVVPAGPFVLAAWPLIVAAAGEIIIGLALGFVVRLAFGAVEMAGRAISTEVGLHAQPGMGVPEPAHEPLAALLSAFAVVLFFLSGAHRGVLTAFAVSFRHASAGQAIFDSGAAEVLIRRTALLIEVGLRIAAPFIALNFLVTLAFAVMARAVPKTNVFILSLPARSLLGLGLLASACALIARYLSIEFADTPLRMLLLLPPR